MSNCRRGEMGRARCTVWPLGWRQPGWVLRPWSISKARRGGWKKVALRIGTPIYVDYAHTPDSLKILEACARTPPPLHVVFGCGGDATGQAALMGAVAVWLMCGCHRRQSSQRGSRGDPQRDIGSPRGAGDRRSREAIPYRRGGRKTEVWC
jgi:hypothetical protein